jgi:L-alanine-DL-glutamate epimerase-like enolase superfamily enzyme
MDSSAGEGRQAMKITDVKAVYVDHGPGLRPFSDGGWRNQSRLFGYVEVFTDQGLSGFCPSAASPEIVEGPLKAMIVGENPLEVERIWTRMFQGWRHPKMDDLMAISKVDCAIWDVAAQILGQPVWRLLGGARREVRAYGAGGMYMPGKDADELAAEMLDFASHGYTAVKMKVAGAPFDEDVARVRAVREAIGPRVDLMLDANHAWTAPEAIRFARAVEQYTPYWFEEPVMPWDYKGCAEVARALDVPVATGENVGSLSPWRDLIDARGCDIVQADPLYCGGMTEWRRIAAYAAAHGLPVAPHGVPHVGAHCVAGLPNGLIAEVGLYGGRESEAPPIVAPLRVEDGVVRLGDEPGFGFKIDRDALAWNTEHSAGWTG